VKALRHRTALFFLAVALAWSGWEIFLAASAPGRIGPALGAVLGREPFVNVAVTLGFAPEDFHIRLFQEYGVVSGVQGTTVLLNRVRPEDVRRIAHYYWVRQITAR
jgi:hypothetical protein